MDACLLAMIKDQIPVDCQKGWEEMMGTAVVVADVIERERELAYGKGKKNTAFVSLKNAYLKTTRVPPKHVVSVFVWS